MILSYVAPHMCEVITELYHIFNGIGVIYKMHRAEEFQSDNKGNTVYSDNAPPSIVTVPK